MTRADPTRPAAMMAAAVATRSVGSTEMRSALITSPTVVIERSWDAGGPPVKPPAAALRSPAGREDDAVTAAAVPPVRRGG